MSRFVRSRTSSALLALAACGIAAFFVFGSFGKTGTELGVGQRSVSAQPSGFHVGQSGVMMPVMDTANMTGSAQMATPTDQQVAFRTAGMSRARDGMRARAARLPASDPRVAGVPQRMESVGPWNGTNVEVNAPGPKADNTASVFRTSVLNPAGAGLPSSDVNEPAVAQNGRHAFMTWNWGAAQSNNDGTTWTYLDPDTFTPGMADFCCDQDVIYDKGRNSFFWLRMGIGFFPSGLGGTENRHLINVSDDAFHAGGGAQCFYDIRPSLTGNAAFANTWLDFPRMALSNDWLYVQQNVFNSTTNAYVTHLLFRFKISEMANCAGVPYEWFNVTSAAADGWSPALVENARETMFMGDPIIVSAGLNTGFRVYWIFDDAGSPLSFVNKVINSYEFISGDAVCTVPGGFNPCARADIRPTGGVILHNSPMPAGLGASGDRVEFFWNAGPNPARGFGRPYVESATFHAGTLNYGAEKWLAYSNATPWYAAAGANDRDHVGLTSQLFYDVPSGANPAMLFAIDDNYNAVPPNWEAYAIGPANAAWTTNRSGDYTRLRKHAPAGVGWIFSSFYRSGGQYVPSFVIFGRERDLKGITRFDQQ
jgi:hypothetical protein